MVVTFSTFKGHGKEFERELLTGLASTGATMLVDLGGSEQERQRVLEVLPKGALVNDGAFAPFASSIAHGKLFVGYDSAGGHVASACGVPQISIFRGEVSERMFQRWRPNGHVLRGDGQEVLPKALAIASAILAP